MTNNCKHENSPSERMVTLTLEEWEAWRKAAGLNIDPETAEIVWEYTQVGDPYGVWPNVPEEGQCVGRSYFARSHGMDVWIEFGDLPDATRDALWEKHESEIPAWLDFVRFVQDFVPRNFGSMSDDDFVQAMRSACEALWTELNETPAQSAECNDESAVWS